MPSQLRITTSTARRWSAVNSGLLRSPCQRSRAARACARTSACDASPARPSRAVTVVPSPPMRRPASAARAPGRDVGESVLRRAVTAGVGGALLAPRHHLLLAWLSMARGRLATAQERLAAADVRAAGPQPRDRFFAAALKVGLARRGTDLAALHRAWPYACEAVVQHPVDLFTVLPLGELAVAAARLGDQQRLSAHLDAADDLLRSLAHPPLWAIPRHWSGLHAAMIAEQPGQAEQHVAALTAYRGHSAYAAAVAAAAESWLAVSTGEVDPAAVEAAARGLHAAGMCWDAARLAGQAAIRTSDRRAMTALLECARLLRGEPPGGHTAASPRNGSAAASLPGRRRR